MPGGATHPLSWFHLALRWVGSRTLSLCRWNLRWICRYPPGTGSRQGMGLAGIRLSGHGVIMTRTTESQRSGWAVALIIAIAIAAVAGFWIGTRQAPSTPATGTSTAAVAPNTEAARIDASGRKVLYWHDPMYPGQKFDKPGKSPFMDMDLVPVYADSGSDESSVSIS